VACPLLSALPLAALLLGAPSLLPPGPAALELSTGAAACSCALVGADWSDRDLEFADLRGCDLREVDLSGSRMVGARLQGARLDGADLRGADLRMADLSGASLRGADLRDADLSSAQLAGASALADARWAGAVCPEEVVADAVAGCASSSSSSR
jgi:uncharacterized protein YjbI with pentapeptide repeats